VYLSIVSGGCFTTIFLVSKVNCTLPRLIRQPGYLQYIIIIPLRCQDLLKEYTIARLDDGEYGSDDKKNLAFPAGGQGVIVALSLPIPEDDQADTGIASDDT
jgi:hypothetical protein